MAEPLGATASVIAIAEVVLKIIEIGNAAYKSSKEKERFNNVLGNLKVLVDRLQVLEATARENPDDSRYAGLRAIFKSSKDFPADGSKVEPDDTQEQPGVLERLLRAMEKMEDRLKHKSGKRAKLRQAIWYYERDDVQKDIDEVKNWTGQVDSVLISGGFEVGIDSNTRIKFLEEEALKAAEDRKIAIEDRRVAALRDAKADSERESKNREKLRLEIIKWISPLRFRERQFALLTQPYVDFTKPKLLQTEEFQLWADGRPWLLHCEGKPGSGKTQLCAVIGKHLTALSAGEGGNVQVLYMYLSHKERDCQSLEILFASLLKQMIQSVGSSFRSQQAQRLYQGKESGTRPNWKEFFDAFCWEAKEYERVFIIVDALDEASPRDVAPQLLRSLQKLAKDYASVMLTSQRTENKPPPTLQIQCDHCGKKPLKAFYWCHICHDGRFYICEECRAKDLDCEDDLHCLTQPGIVLMNVEPTRGDIEAYIRAEFNAELELGESEDDENYTLMYGTTPLGRLLRGKAEFQAEILDWIVGKADGMYALAGLYMSSIKNLGLTEPEIMEMLDDPPEGYSGFYEQHMNQISRASLGEVGSNVGLSALLWVVCANRPLRFVELQDALAINFKKLGFFNPSARRDKATIVRATAGLITIEEDEYATVRLNHSTAQRYFDSQRDRWFPNASAHITRVSLHYLSLEQLSSPGEGEWEDKEIDMRALDYPFLDYAYQYWGDHAGGASSDPDTKAAVLEYVSNDTKVASAIQAMWYIKSGLGSDWNVRRGANGLHLCAWFGLFYGVSELLDRGIDANSIDPRFAQTPLMYACKRGQTESATVLLDRGARINMISNRGSSALFEAVSSDRIEVLKLLLARPKTDVNARQLQRSHQTALMVAVQGGNAGIVDLLLAHDDLDINQKDANGDTALSHAIKADQTAIAMQLLNSNIQNRALDLDSTNWAGRSALIIAASQGQSELVEKLMTMGADPSLQDEDGGGTAILRAISEGHAETVETMLKHSKVNIHDLDDQNRGLLHGAAISGQGDILNTLIRKGLDVNALDKNGTAPLHDASKSEADNSYEMTQSLLAAGADRSLKDHAGRTPWAVAWQKNHTAVMNVLEGRDPWDMTEQDPCGGPPNAQALSIWSLAALGLQDHVAKAIKDRKSDIHLSDPDTNDTALHHAVWSNHPEIVEILLEAGLSPDAKNLYLRTPLHFAAMDGNIPILNLLLQKVEAEDNSEAVDALDKWGTSPLLMAYSEVHIECCLLLVEAGATIPPSKASMKQSLFFAAIDNDKLEAVQRLVQMGADVAAKNILGLTGLRMAKERGKHMIEKFLRRSKTGNSIALGQGMVDYFDEEEHDQEEDVEKEESEDTAREPALAEALRQSKQVEKPVTSPTPSLEERFKALETPRHPIPSNTNEITEERSVNSRDKRVRIPQYA